MDHVSYSVNSFKLEDQPLLWINVDFTCFMYLAKFLDSGNELDTLDGPCSIYISVVLVCKLGYYWVSMFFNFIISTLNK